LSTAQADHARLAQDKQALQQQLQTNCDELGQSLQQLEGLKQDIDQREAAHKQQLEGLKQDIDQREAAYKQQLNNAAKLQSELLASQQTVESLQAQSDNQANSMSGDCALYHAVSCQSCD